MLPQSLRLSGLLCQPVELESHRPHCARRDARRSGAPGLTLDGRGVRRKEAAHEILPFHGVLPQAWRISCSISPLTESSASMARP
jgi:hypothetical protein